MKECELCGAEGSRVQVNHKEYGRIMVCSDCWQNIYKDGKKICTGTGSSSDRAGGCLACR